VYDCPLPVAVVAQHPSWLVVGHELVLVPVGQLETLPDGYVVHVDLSADSQLMPPPPPPLLLDELLQATMLELPTADATAMPPARARPKSALFIRESS